MNKKSLLVTIFISFGFIIVLVAFLKLSKTKSQDEEILVNSGYTDNYIPKIKKKELPEIEPKKEIPKEEPKPEPIIQEPIPLVYEVDYAKIANVKRANEDLIVASVSVKQKQEPKPNNKLYYASEFEGLDKDEAQDPVKLDLVITADRFIPVILKTAISSNLPGGIIASVEEDIYSTQGSNLLIPKGSSVFGNYESLSKGGESRLEIFWTRILTPQGVNINLTNSTAVDIQGKSGATGELDNHLFEKYGIALTLSTVTSAVTYLALKGSSPKTTPEAQLNNNLIMNYKNDISSIANEILKQNMELAPVIKLHIGQRLLIRNNLDIWFNKLDEKNIEILYYQRGKKGQG